MAQMADRVGFEPTVTLLPHTLSRRAHSTTLAPVRLGGRGGGNLAGRAGLGNANFGGSGDEGDDTREQAEAMGPPGMLDREPSSLSELRRVQMNTNIQGPGGSAMGITALFDPKQARKHPFSISDSRSFAVECP